MKTGFKLTLNQFYHGGDNAMYSNFPIRRLLTDLDQYMKRFISKRRQALAYIIGQYSIHYFETSIHISFYVDIENKKFIRKKMEQGRNTLSFKKFLLTFSGEISYRLVSELRILAESFAARGKSTYYDVILLQGNHKIK